MSEKEITLGGETLITKILAEKLKEKGGELLKGLEKELERKRFTLKHLSSAHGMFYNWVLCSCCEYPKVEIIGQYKTVRYGINYEYNIHYPKSTIKLGKILLEGREYTVHLAGLRIIAIYNNYIQGIGWTTVISQVIDQSNTWYSVNSGVEDLIISVKKKLMDYKTENTLIITNEIKEIINEIIEYLHVKEESVKEEIRKKYLDPFA